MRPLLLILAAILCCPLLKAQDSDDADIRLNPELGTKAEKETNTDFAAYPFLNIDANRLIMNGDDWSELRSLFAASGDTTISIVHIGDSHIQAEGSTSATRALLQSAYGSAGRGLVTPLKLAGTNQPVDYSITSASRFTAAKLMKQPWPAEMGFTGISISPMASKFAITIAAKPHMGSEPDFSLIRVFASGAIPRLTKITDAEGRNAEFSNLASGDTLSIFIPEPLTSATLHFESRGKGQIHGFLLENQMTGVIYSAIGNNGATFSAYNAVGNLASDLRALSPNLIILSMGTNEAFGNTTAQGLAQSIDVMVRNLRRANPGAKILLTTPAECQRSRLVRSGKGKKRRRSRIYSVNAKVAALRSAILSYGADHGIPVYDFYAVAGGDGSSQKWLDSGLMRSDRIHYSWDGYALMGTLLFHALNHAISPEPL